MLPINQVYAHIACIFTSFTLTVTIATCHQKNIFGMIKILVLAASFISIQSFYLPGVIPHSFESGDQVDLKVNKLR